MVLMTSALEENDPFIRHYGYFRKIYKFSHFFAVSKKQENERKYSKQLEPYNDLEPELKLNDQPLTKPTRPAVLNYRPTTTTTTPHLFSSTAKVGSQDESRDRNTKNVLWKEVDISPRLGSRISPENHTILKWKEVDIGSKSRRNAKSITFTVLPEAGDHSIVRARNKVEGKYEAKPISFTELKQENKVHKTEYVPDQESSSPKSEYLSKLRSYISNISDPQLVQIPIELFKKRPIPIYILEHHFRNSEEPNINHHKPEQTMTYGIDPRGEHHLETAPDFHPEAPGKYHPRMVQRYYSETTSGHEFETPGEYHSEMVPEYHPGMAPVHASEPGYRPLPPGFLPEQTHQPAFFPNVYSKHEPAKSEVFSVYQPSAPATSYNHDALQKRHQSEQSFTYQPFPKPSYQPYMTLGYGSESLPNYKTNSEPAAPAYLSELPLTYQPILSAKQKLQPSSKYALQPPPRYSNQPSSDYKSDSGSKQYETAFVKQRPVVNAFFISNDILTKRNFQLGL